LGDQGGAGNLVICEVQKIHIREEYLNEAGNLDQQKLDMVARLGSNWYSRSNENSLFEVPKPW
jgi:flavin reductase (DIM6/NTAB) family NADH-FMN oxidoreductase RutF